MYLTLNSMYFYALGCVFKILLFVREKSSTSHHPFIGGPYPIRGGGMVMASTQAVKCTTFRESFYFVAFLCLTYCQRVV